jgi:hypothetical protein
MIVYQSTKNHITEDILTDKSVGSGLTMFDKRFGNSKTIMNRIKINIYMDHNARLWIRLSGPSSSLSSHKVYNTLLSYFVLHAFTASSLPGSTATRRYSSANSLTPLTHFGSCQPPDPRSQPRTRTSHVRAQKPPGIRMLATCLVSHFLLFWKVISISGFFLREQ